MLDSSGYNSRKESAGKRKATIVVVDSANIFDIIGHFGMSIKYLINKTILTALDQLCPNEQHNTFVQIQIPVIDGRL